MFQMGTNKISGSPMRPNALETAMSEAAKASKALQNIAKRKRNAKKVGNTDDEVRLERKRAMNESHRENLEKARNANLTFAEQTATDTAYEEPDKCRYARAFSPASKDIAPPSENECKEALMAAGMREPRVQGSQQAAALLCSHVITSRVLISQTFPAGVFKALWGFVLHGDTITAASAADAIARCFQYNSEYGGAFGYAAGHTALTLEWSPSDEDVWHALEDLGYEEPKLRRPQPIPAVDETCEHHPQIHNFQALFKVIAALASAQAQNDASRASATLGACPRVLAALCRSLLDPALEMVRSHVQHALRLYIQCLPDDMWAKKVADCPVYAVAGLEPLCAVNMCSLLRGNERLALLHKAVAVQALEDMFRKKNAPTSSRSSLQRSVPIDEVAPDQVISKISSAGALIKACQPTDKTADDVDPYRVMAAAELLHFTAYRSLMEKLDVSIAGQVVDSWKAETTAAQVFQGLSEEFTKMKIGDELVNARVRQRFEPLYDIYDKMRVAAKTVCRASQEVHILD